MTETTEQEAKKRLGLVAKAPRLEHRPSEMGQVRQSFPHGRTKTVQVEVRKKRFAAPAPVSAPTERGGAPAERAAPAAGRPGGESRKPAVLRALTGEERAARTRALQGSLRADVEAKRRGGDEARRIEGDLIRQAEDEARRKVEDVARAKIEAAALTKAEEEGKKRAEEETRRLNEQEARRRSKAAEALLKPGVVAPEAATEEDDTRPKRPGARPPERRTVLAPRRDEPKRPVGRMTIEQALADDQQIRVRSLAALRRAQEKEKRRMVSEGPALKVVRDVVVPEAITVQDLAIRMAERGGDVIKVLMKMGVMATINQAIDPDTAELVAQEFGHRVKRVAEADVEIGLKGIDDDDAGSLAPRPPVVTVMGHVDHGKTSLLDALRETDVAKREAGGITQHIGAYQVQLKSGRRITFLDTPGHEAFTAMRARGASVTDIVVLVVAADDGVQPQTIEAINHAKAAGAPIVVAINKVDKPDADPVRARRDLLQHDIAVEGMGGDVLAIDVSATKKMNLDKLEEAILLQAELLDLKANPKRPAQGVVVEAKLERGRGSVATVLIRKGTLRLGDIFVAGSEWGRVRALVDYAGRPIEDAGPSMPVEVLGLNGTPLAGDDLSVVETEARAREIVAFRQRKQRDARVAEGGRSSLEQMFSKIAVGAAKELGVVVKTDVQGSLEAIEHALNKLSTEEVKVRVLHSAVGAITEGDVTLAKASAGLIVAFNVRASPQAREIARRDGVEIRYYSIIYDIVDDIRAALSGMLAPTVREKFLGNAEIREVFEVSKSGKVAGCRVTEGLVKRGAKVRLLRDSVVIHEGTLKTLRRFKEEVREVQQGYECGMAFENYQDIRQGDTIECFEQEQVARTL